MTERLLLLTALCSELDSSHLRDKAELARMFDAVRCTDGAHLIVPANLTVPGDTEVLQVQSTACEHE